MMSPTRIRPSRHARGPAIARARVDRAAGLKKPVGEETFAAWSAALTSKEGWTDAVAALRRGRGGR